MEKKIVLVVLLYFFNGSYGIFGINLDPDTALNLFQFIERHNYTYENYTVVTPDKYILKTVRLPRGKNETASNVTKPAVLLIHGIWSNPGDLILKGDSSIGFMLVEAGYDVFLMATRGNTYSPDHETLSTDSVAYWNFSFHEIGYYDIPTNMDLITNLTGNQNVSIIGHSQGGTAFFTFAATRPDYLARVTVANLFAPVVYMDYSRIPLFPLFRDASELATNVLLDLKLNKGLFEYSPLVRYLTIIFCHPDSLIIDFCGALLGLGGPDPIQLNKSIITVMASNDPAGGSFNSLLQYLQIAKSSEFRQFNYYSDNINVYGQSSPPAYNLSSILDVPIYIWYGLNDYFAGAKDYKRLVSEIPSAIDKQVSFSLWNHIDFAFAIDAATFVYDEVLEIMNSVV